MNVQPRDIIGVNRCDLLHILTALQATEAELEQLEDSERWFSSDSLDRIVSSKQILCTAMDITETYEDSDHEVKQATPDLRFE